MGESACLRRSLSQPSGSLRESKESGLLRSLRESVSFGRFTAESLDWERWSAFSHNRYLEEAERFSKPGSVAQKKAYFEAHFKKKAAERAVTLFEASTSASDVGVAEHLEQQETSLDEQEQPRNGAATSITLCSNDGKLSFDRDESGAFELENEEKEEVGIHTDVESSDLSGFTIEKKTDISEEASAPEVSASTSDKQNPKASPKTSSPEVLLSSAKRAASVSKSKSFVKDSVNKRNTKSLHMSVNFSSGASLTSKKSLPVEQKMRTSKNLTVSVNGSKNGLPSSQAKPKASPKGASKIPSLNLKSSEDKRSYRTRQELNKPVSGGITSNPKLISASADSGTTESAYGRGNKPRSSVMSSPFSFRSEERAAKRKEFYKRLEERKNADGAGKKNAQTKYQPRSPALGRKSTLNKNPVLHSRSSENTKSKSVETERSTNRSVTSRSQKSTRENASPNIQKSASKV